jgi:CspA family cold shock protein
MSIMAEGTVRWFSIEKGFGFIERLSGKDVLVHGSAIQGKSSQSLSEGDLVEFETVHGPHGPHAAKVRKLAFLVPKGVNNGGA